MVSLFEHHVLHLHKVVVWFSPCCFPGVFFFLSNFMVCKLFYHCGFCEILLYWENTKTGCCCFFFHNSHGNVEQNQWRQWIMQSITHQALPPCSLPAFLYIVGGVWKRVGRWQATYPVDTQSSIPENLRSSRPPPWTAPSCWARLWAASPSPYCCCCFLSRLCGAVESAPCRMAMALVYW